MDEIKHITKGLLLNKTKASKRRIADKFLLLLFLSGVLVKEKLKIRSRRDEITPIPNVSATPSVFINPVNNPATIQPIVPKTSTFGNSLPASFIV